MLHTSQSSISRHIADLEKIVGGQLFIREKQRVRLSGRGEHLYRSVSHGLDSIRSGMRVVSDWTASSRVTIACTHAVSHLLLMPIFEALNEAVGEANRIRILSYEYEAVEVAPDPQIDIVFGYGEGEAESPGRIRVLAEAVRPMCSPSFLALNQSILDGPVSGWLDLPLLSMALPNRGWATWEDWFRYLGVKYHESRTTEFENYVYLLEAAAGGRGIALGARGLIESYLETNRLVALADEYYESERALYAMLTGRGQDNPVAQQCLAELGKLIQGTSE